MKKALSCALAVIMLAAIMAGAFPLIASDTEPADGEILYENDFANGLPSDFRVVAGEKSRVSVKDGFLYLDATGLEFVRVLLPESLDKYGNYEITVSATITAPRDSARWSSIVYRVQNANYPYYQMCVRSNATAANGVEFALRNESNGWNVTSTGSFDEALSESKLYTLTARVEGEEATHSINGEKIIECSDAYAYLTGGIGLQANFCTLKVDSIKVTYIKVEEKTEKTPEFVQFAQPDTGIIGGYTFSEFVDSQAKLDAMNSASVKPANVIFRVNKELMVTDASGAAFAGLSDAIASLGELITPTVYVSDAETVTAVCGYFDDADLQDVYVMSGDAALVKSARSTYRICRGVLDFTEKYKGKNSVTKDELLEIRSATNAALATVAVVPSDIATSENVKYLYDRLISVWVNSTSPVTTLTQAFGLVAAGGHGAISDNTAMLYEITQSYMSGKKLLRTPLIIGHRGIPTKAPENTVEGSRLAVEYGADVIENDVYLTSDGEIVVMHDGSTGRTCGTNISIEGSTLEQLRQLTANAQFPKKAEYANVKIPTLEEYYQAFKDKDTQIFVEIKSANIAIVQKIKDLTEEYGMSDQISLITFHETQVRQVKKIWPEMSCGLLCGNIATGTSGEKMEQSVLKKVQLLGSTYNPSYSGHTSEYITNANMRGTLTWPWTIDDKNTYISFFMQGFNGLTTNTCNTSGKFAKSLVSEAYTYEVKPGDTLNVGATMTTYNRTSSAAGQDVRVILLEGADNVTVGEGNVLTFGASEKTVTYALEYSYKINTSNSYTLYTQPVTVSVKAPVPETTASPETAGQTPEQTSGITDGITTPGGKSVPVWVWIAAVAGAAVIVTAIVVVSKKK